MGTTPSSLSSKDVRVVARSVHFLLFGGFFFFLCLKISAIFALPLIGDEWDDFRLLTGDFSSLKDFFAEIGAPDQSRMGHLLAAPIFALLGWSKVSLVLIRLCFLGIQAGFVFLAYQLIRLAYDRRAALIFACFLVFSSFLNAFSVFTLSTGDSLFLFFHFLVLLLYWRRRLALRAGEDPGPPVLLSWALGACIASKLFGVFLLGSLFSFDLLEARSSTGRRWSVPPKATILSGIFLAALALVNLLRLQPGLQLVAALCLATGYGLSYLWLVLGDGLRSRPSGLILHWLFILLTAFCAVLVFSPTYLNLQNILRTFSWVDQWKNVAAPGRSHLYDMALIILMKFGALSLFALAISGVALLRNEQLRDPFAVLATLIFLVHLTVISLAPHKMAWYPLAIFPFLYLPLSLWARDLPKWPALLLIGLVISDNTARYLRWYPYSHFDGAQYGTAYRGYDRAGFISIEVLEPLAEKLATGALGGFGMVHCRLHPSHLLNDFFCGQLRERLSRLGQGERFQFRLEDPEEGARDYLLLSSPLYMDDARLPAAGYTATGDVRVKDIPIVTAWRRHAR